MATSKVTLNETRHSQVQAFRRGIDRRELQAARKYGDATAQPNGSLRFTHDGRTLVTDADGRTAITAWRDTDSSERAADKYVPLGLARHKGLKQR